MLDRDKYTRAECKQQSDRVREYAGEIVARGGKTTRELELLARLMGRKQAGQERRQGGGDNALRTVARWFTQAGQQRDILPASGPSSFVGRSLLDEWDNGERWQRVIIAQGLSEQGIEREVDGDGDGQIHIEYHSHLSECVQYCDALLREQETGEDTRFLRYRPDDDPSEKTLRAKWYKLLIRLSGRTKWQVMVYWYEATYEEQIDLINGADSREATPLARAVQELSMERMQATSPASPGRITAGQVLKHMEYHYWLRDVEEIHEGVWAASLGPIPDGWGRVARAASMLTGGHWFYRDGGLTWQEGSRTAVVMPHIIVPDVMHSRQTVEAYTGQAARWTVPALARQSLRWVRPDAAPNPDIHLWSYLVELGRWGYTMCRPTDTLQQGVHIDARSYYYELACRALTPEPITEMNRPVRWRGQGASAQGRYRDMLAAVRADKKLRNTIVGCMAGGGQVRTCYHRGEVSPINVPYTDWAVLGWLIARSGWEMCREAAEESNAVLSLTDCVITTDRMPQVWAKHGIPTEIKSRGDVEVYSPHSHRVGPRETVPYQRGDRERWQRTPQARPAWEYYPTWVS